MPNSQEGPNDKEFAWTAFYKVYGVPPDTTTH